MECTELEWIRVRSIIDPPANYGFLSQQWMIDFVRQTRSTNLKLALPTPFDIKELSVISNFAPHLVTTVTCGHHSLAGTLSLFPNVSRLTIASPCNQTIVLDTYPNYANLTSLILHHVVLPQGPFIPFANIQVEVRHVSLTHVDGCGAIFDRLSVWPIESLCIHDTAITASQFSKLSIKELTHFAVGVNGCVSVREINQLLPKCTSLRSLWMSPIPFRELIQHLGGKESSPFVVSSVKDITFGSNGPQCLFPYFPAVDTDQMRAQIGPIQALLSKFFPSLESIPIKFSLESWQTYPNLAKLTKLELTHKEGTVTTDLKPFLSSTFNLRQFSLYNFHQINSDPLIIHHPQLQELSLGRVPPHNNESFKIQSIHFNKLPNLKSLILDGTETTDLVMSPGSLPKLESLQLYCSSDSSVFKQVQFWNWLYSLPLVAPQLRYLCLTNVQFSTPALLLVAQNFPGWVVWHSESTTNNSPVYQDLYERVSDVNKEATPPKDKIPFPRTLQMHDIGEFEHIIYDVPTHDHNFLKWNPQQVPILLIHTDFHLQRK